MGTIVIDEKYDKWRKMLKEDINRKRYIHSISVSNTAACLAMRYGCDVWKAYVAGLLHDCAKGLSEDEMIRAVTEADIELSEIEKSNPELLHAKAGSVLARSKYEINDDDILDAIKYHTTGRPSMTLLEKIIFTADYIEPNRSGIPDLDSIRQVAFTDIDNAIILICKASIEYLEQKNRVIDVTTIDTYEFYSNIGKEE